MYRHRQKRLSVNETGENKTTKGVSRVAAVRTLKRPEIETDHLLTNFDRFYEGVVSR